MAVKGVVARYFDCPKREAVFVGNVWESVA